MKKLFLFVTTALILTSCNQLFEEPAFVGSWYASEDQTEDFIEDMDEQGINITGITVVSTMYVILTTETFEMNFTTVYSGDESEISANELVDVTEKFAKGTIKYTETEIYLTASHYGDSETGQNWVSVSGQDTEMGNFIWSVSGNTLTVYNDYNHWELIKIES